MSTAHGGQVVASRATIERSRDSLPAGATLIDLGDHRLRDLAEAERVFQVAHPDLPQEFPPLRSLDVHRHNLPESPNAFVGRERELELVGGLLAEARLVTLVGVGGGGKTRLALESARRVLGSFPDGVFFFDLAPLADPQLVAQAVVSALGLTLDRVGPEPGAVLEGLAEKLAARRMLVVLDNCEHLVEPAAALAEVLLRRCPGVTVLATSREPLGVDGEALWRIPSLSVPPEGAADPGAVAAADAVVLLCHRARTADPSFQLTAGNVGAVAQICRRLDGVPLALELAAARFRMLSPDELAARLDDRFRLLTGGSRTALERHRTLRATFDWGYELLSPAERTMLGRLSVFVGGFDLDAAEAVVPDGEEAASSVIDRDDVLGLLALLVDRSWVGMERGDVRTRYRLLETIRQYAAEKLDLAGDGDDVRRRHSRHYVERGTFLPDHPLRPHSFYVGAELDQDNMRAALERCYAAGDIEACLRLSAGLSRFWGLTGRTVEGRTWLERVLAVAPPDPSPALVAVLTGLCFVSWRTGQLSEAVAYAERARALAGAIGDEAGEATATAILGALVQCRGELDEGERLMLEVDQRYEAAGNRYGLVLTKWGLGVIAQERGDLRAAADLYERTLALAAGDEESVEMVAQTLATLGPLTAALGDGAKATRFAAEAIETARRAGVHQILVMALNRAVETAFRVGQASQAVRYLDESLRLIRDRESQGWVAYSLELAGVIIGTAERPAPAARLLGAAEALDRASGESTKGRPLHDHVERCRADLERALGPDGLAAVLDAGARLPVKEAIDLALAELATCCAAESPSR
jgi:predicted ATPase